MDPVTGAGLFATVVGLMCSFKAERAGGDLAAFMSWLKEKHHEDVEAAIQRNAQLLGALSSLLSTNHEALMNRIARLDAAMCAVASHVGEFSQLARAIRPSLDLSDQAVSILRQLVNSQAKEIWERKRHTGDPDEYILMGVVGGQTIEYDEPRFIEDDFRTLCALGLLQARMGGKGTRIFGVTRAAVAFVEAQG